MFNNLNNDIISKSQLHEKIVQNTASEDIFAKTVSYSGIRNKFHFDIPEILKYEKELQERKDDIRKFTNLAISDPDNQSHNDLFLELVKKDVFLSELACDERLLKDIL